MKSRIEQRHLALRAPFVSSGWALTHRDIMLFSITDMETGVSGWGESAPLPVFGSEDHPASLAALDAACAVVDGWTEIPSLTDFRLDERIPMLAAAPSARFAVECALLDLQARREGRTLRALLAEMGSIGEATGRDTAHGHANPGASSLVGGFSSPSFTPADSIPVNAVIGAMGPEATAAAAQRAWEAGFTCLKLKVGGGTLDEDVERIRALRMAVPEDVRLRLDANGAWDFPDAENALREFVFYDIEYIEQPVAAAEINELAALTQMGIIPVAADESAQNLAQARALLERQAVNLFVIKPMAAGSLLEARRFAIDAQARGCDTVFTSFIDSAVGRNAVAQLSASLPHALRPQGLATGALFADDTHRDRIESGRFILPGAAGLGFEPQSAGLD